MQAPIILVKYSELYDLAIQTTIMPVVTSIRAAGFALDGSAASSAICAEKLLELDLSQQKATLSLLGLKGELKKQTLLLIRCTAAASEYTIKELAFAAATDKATRQELIHQMVKVSGAKANDKLNASILAQIFAVNGADDATKKAILSALGLSDANKLLGKSYDELTVKQKLAASFAAMGPMGWVTLALTALPIIIAGVQKLVEWYEELHPSLKELTEEYQRQVEELDSLNSEYDENKKRIEELNELKTSGEITLAQEEELKRIQRQNDLLEEQIQMQKALNDAKEEQVGAKAVEDATDFFSGKTKRFTARGEEVGKDSGIVRLDRAIASYEWVREQIEAEFKKGADADKEYISELQVKEREYLETLGTFSQELQSYAANIDATDPENRDILNTVELTLDRITLLVGGTEAFETVWNRLWGNDSPVEGAEETAKQLTEAVNAQSRLNEGLKKYGSNVDLANRKILKGSGLAGNDLFTDVGADENVTLHSRTFSAKELGGNSTAAILVTPILPDGSTFQSQKDLEDYLKTLLKADGSGFDVGLDEKGITLGVFNEGDIDKSIEKAGQMAASAREANQAFSELYQGGTVQEIIGLLEEMGVDIAEMPIGEFAAMFETAAESAKKAAEEAESCLSRLTEVFDTASDRLKSLQDMGDKLADLNGETIPYDVLSDFLELLPEAADKVSSVSEAQEYLNQEIERQRQVASDTYGNMLILNQNWMTQTIRSSETLQHSLAECYGADLTNFKELADDKWTVEQALISNLSELWQKYSGITTQTIRDKLYYEDYVNPDPNLRYLNELRSVLELREKAESRLSELVSWKPSGGTKTSSSSSGGSASREVEEYTAAIDQFREALERLNLARNASDEIEKKIGHTESLKGQIVLQRELVEAYERESEALKELDRQRDTAISAGVERLRGQGFTVEYDPKSNELWIENLERLNELTAESKGEYDTLQEATNALRKETEELIDTITDLNDENRDGVEDWRDLEQSMREAEAQVLSLLDGIVEEASDAVDSIQNVYGTLHDAADEYAESGYITIDTVQGITKLGQKYLAYLTDENGQLVINEERIRAVIAAKTQDMAIESSLSYIEALRIAKRKDDIETLNDLLYATNEAANATWGFVYANLALAGLDDGEYEQALKNINALRALADSACESIGQTACQR